MVEPRPHEKLEVWGRAMNLCVEIYRITEHFPASEKYGLSSQMRRAAVSVASNIAEGAARGSKKLYIQSLNISRGSLAELDTQLDISNRLKFIDSAKYAKLRGESDITGRMITNLIKALRK